MIQHDAKCERGGEMCGCSNRDEAAASLKKCIGEILLEAVGNKWKRYESHDGFMMWGLVQEDINAAIDRALK